MKESILTELNKIDRIGMDSFIAFLSKSDFFSAPASTKYHSAHEGGLSTHSWNVYERLLKKNHEFNLGLSDDTLRVCGLLHDVCKINFYKKDKKRVIEGKKLDKYNREVDNWVEKEVWVCEDQLPLGHGEKSVIILQQFIKLSLQEIYMIRWHMGAFVGKDALYEYNSACAKEKGIVALHLADMEATHFMEERLGGK